MPKLFYKYKGKDTSLGYLAGTVYPLELKFDYRLQNTKYAIVIIKPNICPYLTKKEFYDEWDKVSITDS